VAAVFPLVMRKAYGRSAGRLALGTSAAAIVGMLTTLYVIDTTALVPAMVVLGPLVVAQIAYWSRKRESERTTWEYLRDEPLPAAA
jgi:hypothetical protein